MAIGAAHRERVLSAWLEAGRTCEKWERLVYMVSEDNAAVYKPLVDLQQLQACVSGYVSTAKHELLYMV